MRNQRGIKMRNTNVPHGWNLCKISSVLTIKHGKSQREIEVMDGKYPILATGGEIGRTNTPIYTKPSVLIGRKGTIDKPQYKGTPFWTVDTLFYSEIKNNIIPKYIFYLFQTINWQAFNEGSTLPSLSANTIMNIKTLMPPKEEQKKIVGILGTWDRAIEELTGLIAEKKELKRGLMQRLLTGTQRLPGFTKPWKKDSLSNLCDIETGKKDVNEGNPAGQYPFFTCAKTRTFADTFSYDKEAILIAGNGDVGNCQYYNGKFEAYQRTYILSNFRTDVGLLFQILNTKMSRYAESQKQQGAMPYIKLGTLTDFIVYMPEEPEEQKAIADVLSKADAEIDLLNQQLDVLKEQKRGLMQKLLTGEIRVKVDTETC